MKLDAKKQVKLIVSLTAAVVAGAIFVGRRIRAGDARDKDDAADCVIAGQQFVIAVRNAKLFSVEDLW